MLEECDHIYRSSSILASLLNISYREVLATLKCFEKIFIPITGKKEYCSYHIPNFPNPYIQWHACMPPKLEIARGAPTSHNKIILPVTLWLNCVGPNMRLFGQFVLGEVTHSMLQSHSWKGKHFSFHLDCDFTKQYAFKSQSRFETVKIDGS